MIRLALLNRERGDEMNVARSSGAGPRGQPDLPPSSIRPRSETAQSLRFVPVSDLALLDPILTTALTTRNHAYMASDTLYGLDAAYRPAPQMVER